MRMDRPEYRSRRDKGRLRVSWENEKRFHHGLMMVPVNYIRRILQEDKSSVTLTPRRRASSAVSPSLGE